MKLEDQISDVSSRLRGLTRNGFEDAGNICLLGSSIDESSSLLTTQGLREIQRAIEWLEQCSRTKRIRRNETSYGYKHQAERWHGGRGRCNGYVSNGALIAGAILLGFQVVRIDGSLNAYINVGMRRPPTGD